MPIPINVPMDLTEDATAPHDGADHLGLYINSFKLGDSSNGLKNLLGTDGFGNCPSYAGNKLDELYAYTAGQGYNYAAYYNLHELSSGGTFTATGGTYVANAMQKAYDAGIWYKSAVVTCFYPDSTAVGAFSQYSGIRAIQRIADYNDNIAANSDERFTHVIFEDEWWFFPYDEQVLGPKNVNIYNSGGTGWVEDAPGGGSTSFTTEFSVYDFIKVNGEWRQVVDVVSNTLMKLDREWDTAPHSNLPYYIVNDNGRERPDYETFRVRAESAAAYIASANMTNKVVIDLYTGVPSYDFKGTEAPQTAQIARLAYSIVQAGTYCRILLMSYSRLPSFSKDTTDPGLTKIPMNRDYYDLPGSTSYTRVEDDILSGLIDAEIGVIISAESATANKTGSNNNDYNFQGYALEGRSYSTARGTAFLPLDSGGTPTACSGACVLIDHAPNVTLTPLTLADVWEYFVSDPPFSGVGYLTATSDTINEWLADASNATPASFWQNFNAMLVFDQETVRGLTIDPDPLIASYAVTQPTCAVADDGIITISATGGVPPYTITWTYDPPGAPPAAPYVPNPSTTNAVGLAPGVYEITVDDGVDTVVMSVTITDPATLDIAGAVTNESCSPGGDGSIVVTANTGTISYVSVVPVGDDPIWGTATTINNLPAGTYDVCASYGLPEFDCVNCIESTIATRTGPTMNIGSAVNPTCYGGEDGQLTATISVATTGPYTFVLYDSDDPDVIFATVTQAGTTKVFTGLEAGIPYKVSVTDAYGCITVSAATITLSNPAQITGVATLTNPTCTDAADGQISVAISNGTGPYILTVNGVAGASGGTPRVATGLEEGLYTWFITDSNGCISPTYTSTLTEPTLGASYKVINVTECDACDGSIELLEIDGNLNDYEFEWNDAITTASRSDLCPGNYTVSITKISTGCVFTKSFGIQTDCDDFTYSEFQIMLWNARCCFADFTNKIAKQMMLGESQTALCNLNKAKLAWVIIQHLTSIEDPGCDECLGCANINTLLLKLQELCGCTCCGQNATLVRYNQYNDTIEPR